jgi:hypothetical protein
MRATVKDRDFGKIGWYRSPAISCRSLTKSAAILSALGKSTKSGLYFIAPIRRSLVGNLEGYIDLSCMLVDRIRCKLQLTPLDGYAPNWR